MDEHRSKAYLSLPGSGPVRRPARTRLWTALGLVLSAQLLAYTYFVSSDSASHKHHVPANAQAVLDFCAALKTPVVNVAADAKRTQSDRFVPGTKPTLILNASISRHANLADAFDGGPVRATGPPTRRGGTLP